VSIECADGSTLRCTADHPIIEPNGGTVEAGRIWQWSKVYTCHEAWKHWTGSDVPEQRFVETNVD
jgi:hypothetical protein